MSYLILNNLGFYIILFIILFHLLSIIIFYKFDNNKIKKAILSIVNKIKKLKITRNNIIIL